MVFALIVVAGLLSAAPASVEPSPQTLPPVASRPTLTRPPRPPLGLMAPGQPQNPLPTPPPDPTPSQAVIPICPSSGGGGIPLSHGNEAGTAGGGTSTTCSNAGSQLPQPSVPH